MGLHGRPRERPLLGRPRHLQGRDARAALAQGNVPGAGRAAVRHLLRDVHAIAGSTIHRGLQRCSRAWTSCPSSATRTGGAATRTTPTRALNVALAVRSGGRPAHVRHLVLHRGGLGLRLRRGLVNGQWATWVTVPSTRRPGGRLDERQPAREQHRGQRHHRHLGRTVLRRRARYVRYAPRCRPGRRTSASATRRTRRTSTPVGSFPTSASGRPRRRSRRPTGR